MKKKCRIICWTTVVLGLLILEHNCHAQTANKNAIPNANRLLSIFYKWDYSNSGSIISGQQIGTIDDTHSPNNDGAIFGFEKYVATLERNSGRKIGLIGINFAPQRPCLPDATLDNAHRSPYTNCGAPVVGYTQDIELLSKFWNSGGLVTVMWQVANPWTGGSAHDIRIEGPFADLYSPNSKIYAVWHKMLDELATPLLALQQKGVVVLFRPLHEANGDWFWWGTHNATPDEFIALWRDMFQYLTYKKNLNNLLWVYSTNRSNSSKDIIKINPGKQYYDILGIDAYDNGSGLSINCSSLTAFGKPIALTEYGPSEYYEQQGDHSRKFDFHNVLDILKSCPRFIYFMAWSTKNRPQSIIESNNPYDLLKLPQIRTLDSLNAE